MRHRFVSILAVILVLAFSGLAPAGEHPWDNKRIYYLMEYMGRIREKGFFIRRPGSFQKRPCIIIEEEKASFSAADSNTPVRGVRIKTIATPDGEALQRSEEAVIGAPGKEVITVIGGQAEFISEGYYGNPGVVDIPPGTLFEVSGEWLAKNAPRPGRVFSADVIDRETRTVHREEASIVEMVSPASGDSPSVWLAEFASEGRNPMFARFTSDGRLLRLESEGLIYQVVSREEYDEGRIPWVGSPASSLADAGARHAPLPGPGAFSPSGPTPSIPIGETVPAWDNFAWLIMDAGPPGAWQDFLVPSNYAQIEYSGIDLHITALRNAPRVDAGAVFPMDVPADIQPHLSATDALPSSHPAILDAARAAVADTSIRRSEPNVLKAVSYLAGWVHQNISLGDWLGYDSSALDALDRRSADSLGHARLFAAMSRSLGVPARICQGFLAHTGRAVFHCWAEVWINGGWIPVDSTVSRVGLPAGYVLAERAASDGVFRVNFSRFLDNPNLTLTLLSAGRETPGGRLAELVVGDRRTYAYSEGDWMANLYWGFAMRLPPSWSGSAKLNSVEVSSADRQASVKCEALAGDYGAGSAELESNIAALRGNLNRFKLVDSRVVSFDPSGATPALFIDFTCEQDGVGLRCRQYVLPRRQRAFRISFWAPADSFSAYAPEFDSMLASFEF